MIVTNECGSDTVTREAVAMQEVGIKENDYSNASFISIYQSDNEIIINEIIINEINNKSPHIFTLFDLFGRKIRVGKSENGKFRISKKDLPKGVYLLRVGDGKRDVKIMVN